MHRRTIMRRARSKKKRPLLRAALERRYFEEAELFAGPLFIFTIFSVFLIVMS